MELRHRRKDGSIFPVEVSANYIEFGGQNYNMAIARNITERKAAEKELLLTSKALNNTNEATYIIKDARFVQVNDGACRMLGYSREEFAAMSVYDIDDDATREIIGNLEETIATDGTIRFERRHTTKDGRTLDVEIVANFFESDGESYSFSAVRDITEQKKAREMLLLQDFALNRINEAVYLIDENSSFHYVNEGACRALGYTKEELLTLGVIDIDPNCTTGWWNIHWDVIKEQKSVMGQTAHKRKDGSVFPIEVSSNYFEYNGVGYSLAVSRDITERLALEEQKDNERMRLFFERQLVGMAITSPQKGWLHTNEKLQQMLGYTHEELTALTWVELTYPDDLAADVEQFERLLKGEIEDYILQKRFVRKDSSLVYANLAVSCVRNDDRSVNYVLALMEDITERKIMEVSLKDANERYIQILDNSTDVIYLIEVTPEGRFVYVDVNAAYEEVTGIPRSVVTGLRVEEIEDETFRAILIDKFNACLNAKSECDYIADYPFPAGIRTFHSVLTPIRDESGRIVRIVGSARDITDRRRMEAELAARERELRALADSSPGMMAVFYMRPDGSVCMPYASPNIYELFGVTVEQVKEDATSILALSHPDDAEMVVRTIDESAQNMSLWHIEYRIVHPTKGIRWMEGNTMPQPHPDGGVVWYGYVHDITGRKEVEETVRLLQHSLEFSLESLFIMDADTDELKFVQVNNATCKTLGYSKEELLGGMGVVDIDPDHNMDALKPHVEELKKVQSFTFETRHKDKNGRIYPVEIRSSYFEHGDKKYILSLTIDITERKQLENELAKERKFLVDAQRVAHTGSWHLDLQNSTLSWSDEAYRIFELDKDSVFDLHATFYEYVHPEDREMVRAPYEESLKTREPYELEHRVLMPDGRIKYVIERCEHAYGSDGTPLCSIGTVQDITERKLMEKELEESHAFLVRLIDSLPDPIFVKDREHRWLILNKANYDFAGIEYGSMIGKTDRDFFPKEEADIFWEKDDEVFASNKVNINEEYFTSSDGATHYIQTIKAAFTGEDGKEYLVGTIRDLSERKKTEEALHSNRNLLHSILESSPGIITFALDKNYRYMAFDSKHVEVMRAIFGKEIAIGMNMLDIIEGEHDKEVAIRSFKRALSGESFVAEEEYGDERLSRKYWRIYYSPICSEDGEIIGLTCFNVDITERRLAEEALKELNETLEEKVNERTAQLADALAFNESIIGAIPDLLFEVDREGRYLNVWAQNEESLAAQKEKLLGRKFEDILSAEATAIALEGIYEAEEKGLSFGKTIKIELADGEHYFELSTSQKGDTFLVISRDITERKSK